MIALISSGSGPSPNIPVWYHCLYTKAEHSWNDVTFADLEEQNSAECDMKENGEIKLSGGKCQTRGGESEWEEGELNEDSRVGSGDSSNGCVKKKTVSNSCSETKTKKGGKRTKDSCGDVKQCSELKEDRHRGSKKQEGDRMASGDLTRELDLSDEDSPQSEAETLGTNEIKTGRAVPRELSKELEKEDKAIEGGTSPQGSGGVVDDTNGRGSKGGGEEDLVEVEDRDDYLMYLEEILKTVHEAFYDLYGELNGEVPDLKSVIPYVRRKVLAGTSLVFSGLVPTHIPLEKSRAYLVARSMGAQVTQDLTPETTHLVAVRPGTAKVNSARRMARSVTVVTPDWLWCCGERWEKVDER
jgi:RNA polymerase II subunit A-like phosphatase